MIKNMNILVTGSSGFVGSHLLDGLLSKNKIIGISLGKNKKKSGCSFIQKDITKISVNDLPEKIDAIIHLAAITDVQYCKDHPQECFATNVLGTQNMLEIARQKDAKVVYASTSHVYGLPRKIPISEDHPTKPLSIYASTKLNGEVCCEGYSISYGMNVSIVRLFSIYGPNSPSHLVTSRIISQLDQDLIKIGNINSIRDFVYITDAVNAIETVLKKSDSFNIYNIGSGKGTSILDICNMLKNISKKNPKIQSVKFLIRKNDAKEITANISKIKKIGWKPTISLEEGLSNTFNWYKTIKF